MQDFYGKPQAISAAPGEIETTAYHAAHCITITQVSEATGKTRAVYLSPTQLRAIAGAVE